MSASRGPKTVPPIFSSYISSFSAEILEFMPHVIVCRNRSGITTTENHLSVDCSTEQRRNHFSTASANTLEKLTLPKGQK